jgi:ParB family chromosome partitioning protein
MAANKGLGKGLAALLSDMSEEENKQEKAEFSGFRNDIPPKKGDAIEKISLDLIEANTGQPRKYFDETALKELTLSIKTHGILQPIICVEHEGKYIIVAGERRFRAAKMAGLADIPVIVRKLSEREVREIAIIENLQREDLNPIEAAEAIKELMTAYKMTQDEVSIKIGKSRPSVTNTLRLLALDPDVISLVRTSRLSPGHARALVVIEDRDMQIKLANAACDNKMSVRDLETRVKFLFASKDGKAKEKEKQSLELKELVLTMKRVFGTKVRAVGNDKSGRISIDYYSSDDLNRIHDLVGRLKKMPKE